MPDVIQVNVTVIETPIQVAVGGVVLGGGTGGGATTFSALTDKATADLPEINTPLASALAGKAAASHSHPASAIADSTATGRAVLTAATPAAARETLGVIRREATTDYTSSSTSLVGAPELTFPVEAGKTYRVDLALVVSSAAAVGGVQVAMSYPTLARTNIGWAQTQLHQTVKFPNLGASSVNLNPNTTGVPNAVTGLSGWVYLRPTSSGDVTFAAGQFSAGTGTVGLLAGSVITVTEL